jgi:hypothetical protein
MKRTLLVLVWAIFLFAACSKDYSRPPSPGRMIKQFKLAQGQIGPALFNEAEHKITVTVLKGTDLSTLSPEIVISDFATISPASGQKINVSSNRTQVYTVKAESGEVHQWQVEFKIYDAFNTPYGAFVITSANGRFLQVSGDYTYNEKFNNRQGVELGDGTNSPLWQKWHLIYHSTVGDVKYYQIRNLHSGKFLSIPDGAAAGAQAEQYQEEANDAQLWVVGQTAALGTYNIVNKKTGLALSNTAGEAKVTQEAIVDNDTEKWTITSIPDQTYRDDNAVRFFERNNPAQGSVAFDQGTSVPLSDGKVLWITQDAWDGSSLRDGMFPCNFFFSYNNSVMIQPSATDWNPEHTPNMTITNSAHGRPKQIFNNQPGTDWSWPGLGVQIGNDVWVQCGEGKGLGATNQSLYKLTPQTATEWTSVRYEPAGMSNQTTIGYATGMVKANDGFVYCFGSQGFSFGYANYIYVARFAESDPLKWTFWNGSAWANAPSTAEAARIATGPGNNTISYLNGKYVMMSMDQGFNCETKRDIYISTATSPTGPFTAQKYIYTINEYLGGKYARYYTPAIHPESVNGRNELLLTYCLNFSGCDLDGCQNNFLNPYYYRVKGIRVPYSIIGL